MEDIRELLTIASPKKVSKLLKISQGKGRKNRIADLHALILKGPDEEADIVQQLYGLERTPSYPAYRALKGRLRDLVTTAIMDEDVYSANYRTYDNAQVNGYQQLNLINLLMSRRAWRSVTFLAHLTLRRVKDYEIVPINSRLSAILASMYLGVGFNEKQFVKYQAMADHYASVEVILNKVSSQYREMRRLIYAHRLLPLDIGKQVAAFVAESETSVKKYPKVSAMQAMFYLMKVHGLTLMGEFAAAIKTADEAERVLRGCKGAGNQSVSLMALARVDCSVKLRDFEEGQRQVDRANVMVPQGTINHIKLAEYAITLGLQTEHFEYAYDRMALVDRKKLGALLTQQHVEFWLILEAYINLLVMAGKVDAENRSKQLPNFKLYRFVNNVPSYSKDKQGMNVQILILQVIFFIINEQYGQVIDRTDALARYGSRYLMNNENLRNNCFFKLLLTAVKCNFHRTATIRESKKIFAKMISPQARKLSRANSTEIVPYETLWDIVLNHLETTLADGRKTRSRARATS